MATNHRGQPVGNPATSHGGHRPTPRLAAIMAGIGGMTLEDGQAFLNTYRDNRDKSAFNVKARYNAWTDRNEIAKAIGHSEVGFPYTAEELAENEQARQQSGGIEQQMHQEYLRERGFVNPYGG